MPRKLINLLLIISVSALCLTVVYWHNLLLRWFITVDSDTKKSSSGNDTDIYKPSLYLIQTEKCAPAFLFSKKTLGDPLLCNCDVIVLSYKRQCQDTRFTHIKYIFDSSMTWSSGRNPLYKTAMEQTEKYLYYVLMDDDLQLTYGSGFSGLNPWRDFEQAILKERLPVVAGVLQGIVEKSLNLVQLETCSGDFVPTWFLMQW